jgi:Domain of unknown function (DUF4126)
MDSITPYIGQIMEFLRGLFASGGDVAGTAGKAIGGMDMAGLAALAAALGWASGIRLYLVVFITGLAGMLGWFPLPAGLSVLQHPAMLAGSGFMLFVEFFADKIPGVDSLWDMVHTVIRVPAGAALAAGVFGADSAMMGAVAALMGGTLAATAHATKATTRAAINTSPEPFSNVAMSLAEEGAVMGMMWLATNYPITFGFVLVVVLVLSIVLIVVLLRFLKAAARKVADFFVGTPTAAAG